MPTKTRRRPNTRSEIENRVAKSATTRTIRRYLEGLEEGWNIQVDAEPIRARLTQVQADIVVASPVQRVQLIQERLDLQAQLEEAETDWGWDQIEADAIAVMAEWAESRGLSYKALRQAGVPAAALKAAGIARTRG